ncbi:DVU_1555 family C-GCAxxG-C-C protein [Desulfomonile tiedjei]|uniref:C_GCAxxG_C_C family probable redox protein n=1 Tax=Desulfomonile tiedjei (strain ATCC 49306 / DSM 6799 / DCB-1) TaxID=706587 RepID=I4C3T4_DESTA|nr:DV_1555 family C-GCAxxG-C-C protein [Desulfomonile tiedjei]AFM24225.1 C_GCAxxG_C_C family probable redox protein [Desulfomonile tiedjei DSM 6799]
MLSTNAVSEDFGRMMELARQGFHCSDILVSMGLEAQAKVNPDAVRLASALAGGIGSSGDICGAFTGGACLLGLYAGRGALDEEEDPRLRVMISELMDWFSAEQEKRYGGIHCSEIIGDDPQNMPMRCPQIVAAVYRRVRTILDQHGFDWKAGPKPVRPKKTTHSCDAACPVAARL